MAVPKKASKTKKAVAVAMVCGGVVVATPRPAAAEVPNISVPLPGPVKKVEIGALKAGASEVLVVRVTFPHSVLSVEVNPNPPPARVPGTRKYTNITLKRGADTARANPRLT